MKRLLFFMLLCLAYVSCTRYNGNLYRIHKNNLYGYIDSTGNVVIEPQFKYASKFQDGLALVISDVTESFHTDTINSIKIVDGNFIIDSLNKTTRKIHDGIRIKYGYINTRGKIIIDTCQTVTLEQNNFCIFYRDVERFLNNFTNDSLEFRTVILDELLPSNGLFLYQDSDSKLWGYKNSKYTSYISPNYKYAGVFSEERAIIELPDTAKNVLESGTFGNYGIIDTDGNVVVEPKYLWIGPYSNGGALAMACKTDDFSFWQEWIGKDGGKIYGPTAYNGAMSYYGLSDNGFCIVKFNLFGIKLYSFMNVANGRYLSDYDDDGQLNLIEEVFEDVKTFNEGYAPVKVNNKWVFIDDNCSILSEEYDSTGVFSESYAKVMFEGKSNKLWGYIDTAFNLVIPYKYSECSDFHDGLAYFKNVNQDCTTEGYVNKQGTVIWSTTIKND